MKLALGTAQFGMNYGIANSVGQVSESEAEKILSFAMDKNIKVIDTASSYGKSEEIIGRLVANSDYNWKIVTKVSGNVGEIENEVHNSVKSLGRVPYAVLSHKPEYFSSLDYCDKLHSLKLKFKIPKIGVSVYNSDDIELCLSNFNVDIVQLPLNILDMRLFNKGYLEKFKNNNIEVHVRSVFLQGLFFLRDKEIILRFPESFKEILKVKELVEKSGEKLSQLSISWVNSLTSVDHIVIGVDNVQQLKANMNLLSSNLDEELISAIQSLNFDKEEILNPSLW